MSFQSISIHHPTREYLDTVSFQNALNFAQYSFVSITKHQFTIS